MPIPFLLFKKFKIPVTTLPLEYPGLFKWSCPAMPPEACFVLLLSAMVSNRFISKTLSSGSIRKMVLAWSRDKLCLFWNSKVFSILCGPNSDWVKKSTESSECTTNLWFLGSPVVNCFQTFGSRANSGFFCSSLIKFGKVFFT